MKTTFLYSLKEIDQYYIYSILPSHILKAEVCLGKSKDRVRKVFVPYIGSE